MVTVRFPPVAGPAPLQRVAERYRQAVFCLENRASVSFRERFLTSHPRSRSVTDSIQTSIVGAIQPPAPAVRSRGHGDQMPKKLARTIEALDVPIVTIVPIMLPPFLHHIYLAGRFPWLSGSMISIL